MKDTEKQLAKSSSSRPKAAWKVIALKECAALWLGGRALLILLMFGIFLSITTYLLASNGELSLIPPKEAVFMLLKNSLSVGVVMSLVLGADSISSERERGSLEALLLTPASRRQIVLGKFLAIISPWFAMLAVSAVYMYMLAGDMQLFLTSIILTGLIGTTLVMLTGGFGLLASIRAKSNRSSLAISIATFLLFALPTLFAGTAQTGAVGKLIKKLDPFESSLHFLEKVIVNNRGIVEMSSFLTSPIVLTVGVLIALFFVFGPRLNLFGVWERKNNSRKGLSVGVFILVFSLAFLAGSSVHAQFSPSSQLVIDSNLRYKDTKTGDKINFKTTVTNMSATPSKPLIIAMNIVNLSSGDPVDPEDWSPKRTQDAGTLAPGEIAEQSWTINTILQGNYLVYLAVIPSPGKSDTDSLPVSSPAVHLLVRGQARLNPKGVLPVVVGVPAVLAFLLVAIKMRIRVSPK